jgi:formate dehydrogenase (NADP+) beta subunit
MTFELVKAVFDEKGKRRLVPTGEPDVLIPCDVALIAVGQENAFPWIEADSGVAFDEWGLPVLVPDAFQSTLPKVFFGGDSAYGPKNIITAVAHGHEAAVSIDRFLNGEDVRVRPSPPNVHQNGHSRMELRQRRIPRLPLQGALGQGRNGACQH